MTCSELGSDLLAREHHCVLRHVCCEVNLVGSSFYREGVVSQIITLFIFDVRDFETVESRQDFVEPYILGL